MDRSIVVVSPQDIVGKKFRESFRGYNQDDVDLFLDEVVEEFTRVAEENQKMKVRLAALQQEVARLREGRGTPPASAGPGGAAEAERLATEVRERVRRFLEEQIRLIEGIGGPSSTVERIARDVPRAAASVVGSDAGGKSPEHVSAEGAREPFWAGE